MKLHGKKIVPNIEVVVIPRQDGNLVFRAAAVLDYTDHDKLNPMPKPPKRRLPGNVIQENVEDPHYKEAVDTWAANKFYYMLLKSLEATDGLEWETVDLSNPKTWSNYKTEMSECGLTPGEVARIEMCVSDACGLNQAKIDEATKRFLAGQVQVPDDASSLSSERQNTPSGEPVSAGT